MIELVGPCIAVIGSLLSIVGTLINNIWLEHTWAMKVWAISNPLLAIWAAGYLLGYWDGGLSVGALFLTYLIFTVTNLYGLWIMRRN